MLIGTSDFQQLPLLPAVGNNLVDLRSALTDDEVGILGWEQCVVVDSPDTPSSLISRLRAAATQAQDLLLVYYAGHGIRVGDEEELYLTVRQSDNDSPFGTCVPFEWVRRAVVDSPARTKLLILDCCFSGMALGTMSAPAMDTRQIEVTGTTVITSSPRNSVSHSLPGERHTAFTGELITLLRAGSPLPEQPLTVAELFRSLLAAMARRELPHPKMRSGDTSGALQLRKFQPPPPPEPEPEPVAVVPEPVALVAEPEPAAPIVEPEPEPAAVVSEPVAPDVVPEPLVVWPQLEPEPAQRFEDPDTIRFAPVKPPLNLAPLGAVARVYLPFFGAIVLIFCVDYALGGYLGAAFGPTSSSDLALAFGTTVGAVIFAVPGIFWWVKGGRWLVLEDAVPSLAKWTAPIRVTLVVVLLVVFAITTIGSLTVSTTPSSTSTVSPLATTVAIELMMFQGAIACGYSLVRRVVRRKSKALPVISSPLPPMPPAHS